jgi:hypothetical protein
MYEQPGAAAGGAPGGNGSAGQGQPGGEDVIEGEVVE